MSRYISHESLERLVHAAYAAGVFPRIHQDRGLVGRRLEWDVSGRCESGRVIELFSRYGIDTRYKKPWWVFLTVPCRKCNNCRHRRGAMWKQRALQEIRNAETCGKRTWVCTLTYSPDHYAQLLDLTRSYADMRGVNFEALNEGEKFNAIVAETSGEFDRFAKRIRSKRPDDLKFRYLWVPERTKAGTLHWHGLVHEVDEPILKRRIQNAWQCGFSHVSLVHNMRSAWYVTKYISKEISSRVRASQGYGDVTLGHIFNPLSERRILNGKNSCGCPDPQKRAPSFTDGLKSRSDLQSAGAIAPALDERETVRSEGNELFYAPRKNRTL